jgi:hypothetical protein
MFRVKEVVPKSRRMVFWREDLKAVRNMKKSEHREDSLMKPPALASESCYGNIRV